MAAVKHVHVDTSSRDCDGLMERSHIDTREFFSLIGHAIGVTDQGMYARVEIDLQGDFWYAHTVKPTDEGYHSAYLRECDEDCDVDERSQRDHSAEAMGY